VGAFALKQTEKQAGRLKLVGFKMGDSDTRAPRDGSIIVDSKIRGYVCISRHSHTLNEVVGLALADESLAETGTKLEIYEDECGDERLYAVVASTPFYDPDAKRLKM